MVDEETPEAPRPVPLPVSRPLLEDPFPLKYTANKEHTLRLRSLKEERFKYKSKVMGMRETLISPDEGQKNQGNSSPKRARTESVTERKRDFSADEAGENKQKGKRPASPCMPMQGIEEEKRTSVSMMEYQEKMETGRKRAVIKPELRKRPEIIEKKKVAYGDFHTVTIRLNTISSQKPRSVSPFASLLDPKTTLKSPCSESKNDSNSRLQVSKFRRK